MENHLQLTAIILATGFFVICVAVAAFLIPAWAKSFDRTAVKAMLKTPDIEMRMNTTPPAPSTPPVVAPSPAPAPKAITHQPPSHDALSCEKTDKRAA
ncbi:hypothetical protein [Caulobacter endophyticus]|uniref:Uncharacterized protein n=1 Tax=Caulobacter endophyticus TaxID=2172652 RepID=A0A2T9K3D5_9CAUL|nr:hypothetical protein [Caulobacter endophyticus]PVM90321.1 hypothetical protein DDF67_10360 [Caulobacter endophyticus]